MHLADVFVGSSNAVTEDGKLFNIDGTGNRVAAMTFGPRKVILVCGVNKIVKDLEEAERRVREWVAPMNVKRLGFKNPCGESGDRGIRGHNTVFMPAPFWAFPAALCAGHDPSAVPLGQ